MAKPTTMPKAKKAKKTKPRKPQPLPRSVQALLKYLGGSDVKLGGARGGQPATLAPTSINIAVSQQQQQAQAQAQQSVRARVAPKGQVVGQSPLGAVIPQAPVIVQQAPASSAETERKIQEQANEINRKFGLLEADQQQFRQAAATAYQDIKQDINRRVAGDANIFDARNIAARFSTTTPRPVVEESQFAGMSFGGGAARPVGTFGGIEVTEVFRGARQEETAPGLAEHLAGQYIKNVSNPEMTEIKRPGRPRKSEAEKAATKAAAAARKKASKPTAAEATSSASLLEQRAPATIAGFTAVPEQGYMLKEPVRMTIMVKKKPVSTTGAPDMATQIALLTGGGAVRPPQSQGQNIAELLGAKKR
jgi:hypothetical protein